MLEHSRGQRKQKVFVVSAGLAEVAAHAKLLTRRSGKLDSFPVAASGVRATGLGTNLQAEHALLLDPCRDDHAQHLAFSFDPGHPPGLLVPRGIHAERERGAVSIQVYGLRRGAARQR
ncbi:hypothetical protein GCM10017612_24230 [Novosphingobium resinovorum]|nr:hypothetical protein GCM10017612_24230 [Novosphingobium resinovorum]